VQTGLITPPTADQVWSKLKEFDEFRKSTTAVIGLEVTRQDLEQELKLAANLDTPLRNRLARRKGEGKAHAYYKLISNYGLTQNTVKFLGTDPTGAFFPKGGLPNAVDPQYQYLAKPYANLGDVAVVPWQDVAQDRSYIDIRAQQRKVKMLNVGLVEEWAIINGNSATSNGLVFDGLLTQIINDGFNIFDLGGSALKVITNISTVCFAVKLAGGRTRALIMSYAMKQALTTAFAQYYAIRQMNNQNDGKYSGGFELDNWNFGTGPLDIIDDQYMTVDPSTGYERIIFLDDKSLDTKNNGNSVEMVDVDPLHYEELMAIATAYRGIVYETSMLQIGITQYQGLLKGISLATPPTLN
jgi:hypothetical protein